MSGKGKCRLCGEDGKLVKAHIVPRSLLHRILDDSCVKMYPITSDSYAKKVPIGPYDREILCAKCDGGIGDWDNYAQRLLKRPVEDFGETMALRAQGFYTIPEFDYSKLKLFFLSVLWRAHITTHEIFGNVDVGPWEAKLHQMISDANPGKVEDFSVALLRYYVNTGVHEALPFLHSSPTRSKSAYARNGRPERSATRLNYYHFRIADYVALIKVDKRPFWPDLEDLLIKPSGQLHIGLQDYMQSSEYKYVIETRKIWLEK